MFLGLSLVVHLIIIIEMSCNWFLSLQIVFCFLNKKQEVRDDLSVCVLNTLPKVCSLLSLLAVNLTKVGYRFFKKSRDLTLVTISKGHAWEPAPCLVWCPHIFCWWRYVFHLSRDPTRPPH